MQAMQVELQVCGYKEGHVPAFRQKDALMYFRHCSILPHFSLDVACQVTLAAMR
jgi:hypothetical protein